VSSRFAAISWVFAGLGLLGCSNDAGGPVAVTAGVSVTDMSGPGGVVACVRVPVLLGSVVLQQRKIDDAFDVEIRALRHEVEFTFPGARNASELSRHVPLASLAAAHSETLSVLGRDGNTYSAVVLTGCSVLVDSDENP
jgi:hypothetical protein